MFRSVSTEVCPNESFRDERKFDSLALRVFLVGKAYPVGVPRVGKPDGSPSERTSSGGQLSHMNQWVHSEVNVGELRDRVSGMQDAACFALTLDRCQHDDPGARIPVECRPRHRHSHQRDDGLLAAATEPLRLAPPQDGGTRDRVGGMIIDRSIEHGDPNGQCSGT